MKLYNQSADSTGRTPTAVLAAAFAASLLISAGLAARDNAQPPPGIGIANPVSFVDTTGLTIGLPGSESGYFMKVTIRGPDDALLVDEVIPADGFHWMPPIDGDGIYRFQAYILTEDLERGGAHDTPVPAPRVHGTFEVRDGYMVVPRGTTGPDDDLSAVSPAPGWFESLVGRGLAKLVPGAVAANLEASSVVPSVSFDDTGNSGQTYEWNLSAYDPFDSTAASEFALYDDVNDRYVLRITESTNNAQTLVVDTNGDIALANGGFLFDRNGGNSPRLGIGTATPSEEVHIKNSTPGVRFEDSSDASHVDLLYDFAQLTIQGNGGQDVVALDAKAPQDTWFIDASGNVGMGTNSPAAALHVERSTDAEILVENTSTTVAERKPFELRNRGKTRFVITQIGGASWTFDNDNDFFNISKLGTGVNEFRIEGNGDAHILGTSFATNHVNTSSRSVKTDFSNVNENTILEKVGALEVSQWRYVSESENSRHIGPTAEDFQRVFGLGDGQHISTVDASGIALAAIKGLREQANRLESENRSLKAKVAEVNRLKDRLEKLEEKLAQLPQ